MSLVSHDDLAHLKIPLEKILSATNNFADINVIRKDGFEKLYKGQLLWLDDQLIDIAARRLNKEIYQGEEQFRKEISMLSSLRHKNLVTFVGFCDETGEKIIIIKHETKGSLTKYLSDSILLTWVRRLEICVGVAHALSYIHYDRARDFSVIHRNISSDAVHLNDDWEPKLSDFEHSMRINVSERCLPFFTYTVSNMEGYTDPTYLKTKSVDHKSDMYSFGIVLFELLCGRRTIVEDGQHTRSLAPMAIYHCREKILDAIIDPDLWEQMDPRSYKIFSETAYDCLKEKRSERPNIDVVVGNLEKALKLQLQPGTIERSLMRGTSSFIHRQFQHLKIPIEAIKSATDDFADTHCIGRGGFGKVYKGELVHTKGQSVVALKRLDRAFGQGNPEFWKEIIMLSLHKHDNIVSLLGFCDDCGEKILIYEYTSKKSLDLYLNDKDLTWVQRLRICIGAAQGLAYLHNPSETHQRVLHRDVKSSNILLDENWNARIADFGLSKFGPANQQYTFLVSNPVGTIGYCDPQYVATGLLTKESDVYSFGVVLFEMLCGRLCIGIEHDKHKPLTGLVRKFYEQKTLDDIIFAHIKDEINPHSLKVFTRIAYLCLSIDHEQRPLMTEVVEVLESALACQVSNEPPSSMLSRKLRIS